MKYLSLLLFFLFSLSSFADTQERTTTFDFTNPQGLNPSITPGVNPNDEVPVPDSGLYPNKNDKSVHLSFTMGLYTVSTVIATHNKYYDYINYLCIPRTTTFVFDGGDNFITSIRFIGLNIGDITPKTEGNYDNESKTWTDNSNVPLTNKVKFEVTGDSWPEITKIEITYQKKMDTLIPTSTSIIDGSSITSFKEFAVTMSQPLKEYNSSKPITIKGDNWIPEQEVSVALSGNAAKISVPEELLKPIEKNVDQLHISIPAGSLIAEDGTYNQALNYSFTLVRKEDTFVPTTITPAEGKVDELQTVKLEFPTECHLDAEGKDVYLYKNGTQFAKMIVEKDGVNGVKLSIAENGSINEPSLCEIKIPKGLICDLHYDANAEDKGLSKNMTYNPELTLTYRLGNYQTPEEIEKMKEPVYQAIAKRDAAVKKAKDYIAHDGVGYPAADSDTRTALQTVIDANPVQENYDVAIEDIEGQVNDWNAKTTAVEAAITAFVADQTVTMLTEGKYYTIANVAKDGSKLYLAYKKGAVSLTEDATKALPFLFATKDGNSTFATPDNAYLHILKPATEEAEDDKFINSNSVTKEYIKEVNGLTVAKFAAEGIDAADVFGLMSIHGTVSTTLKGLNYVAKKGFCTVNTTDKVAYLDKENKASFTDGLSSAFIFTESAEKPIPEVVYTLTPDADSNVSDLNSVSITFSNISDVTYKENSVVLKKAGNDAEVAPESVTRTEDGKTFTFTFKNVEKGTYTLVMKNGAFIYKFDDKDVTVEEITAQYTVTSGYDFIYNYNDGSANLGQFLGSKTEDLINFPIEQIAIFGLQQRYDHFAVDSTKVIELREEATKKVMFTGHFDVKNHEDIYFSDEKTLYGCTVWFKPDTEIDYSKLNRNHYQYVIPAATFGDANFGKYLKDKNSVSKSDCRVNGKYVVDVYIDNNATGIDTIESEQNVVIYDMMGRRVSKITKAGVYIINGKKYIKK